EIVRLGAVAFDEVVERLEEPLGGHQPLTFGGHGDDVRPLATCDASGDRVAERGPVPRSDPVGVQGDVRVGALEFVEERLKGLLLGGVTHVEEAQLPGAIPGSTVAPGPASTSGEGTERREPEGSESPGPKYLAPLHRGRLTST